MAPIRILSFVQLLLCTVVTGQNTVEFTKLTVNYDTSLESYSYFPITLTAGFMDIEGTTRPANAWTQSKIIQSAAQVAPSQANQWHFSFSDQIALAVGTVNSTGAFNADFWIDVASNALVNYNNYAGGHFQPAPTSLDTGVAVTNFGDGHTVGDYTFAVGLHTVTSDAQVFDIFVPTGLQDISVGGSSFMFLDPQVLTISATPTGDAISNLLQIQVDSDANYSPGGAYYFNLVNRLGFGLVLVPVPANLTNCNASLTETLNNYWDTGSSWNVLITNTGNIAITYIAVYTAHGSYVTDLWEFTAVSGHVGYYIQPSYDTPLAPNATISFGYNSNHTYTTPAGFALYSVLC